MRFVFPIASFERINICHLHGGEKTIGSFDDTIRHVVTNLVHFILRLIIYKKRLISLGENEKIFLILARLAQR